MTTPYWIRLRARSPRQNAGSENAFDAAIALLEDALNLSRREASAFIEAAAQGEVRVHAESERLARFVVRQLAVCASEIGAWAEPQQRVDGLILVLPTKTDAERDAVADAWIVAGGSVERLDRFWDPPPLPRERVRLYGPATFALVVAQKLEIDLAEPDPYAVIRCPAGLVRRAVSVERLHQAPDFAYPCFVKPIVPKQFAARIYRNFDDLSAETQGLDGATEVLRSEVVTFVAEARSFVLDGVIQACAIYEGAGNLDVAAKTCERVANALDLPRAAVLDVGLLASGEWVFLEANAAWGAGLNGCDPYAVLACIAAASGT